jgi:hypothetical protein
VLEKDRLQPGYRLIPVSALAFRDNEDRADTCKFRYIMRFVHSFIHSFIPSFIREITIRSSRYANSAPTTKSKLRHGKRTPSSSHAIAPSQNAQAGEAKQRQSNSASLGIIIERNADQAPVMTVVLSDNGLAMELPQSSIVI